MTIGINLYVRLGTFSYSGSIEFDRSTQCWHFCLASNGDKMEKVTSGINFTQIENYYGTLNYN